jgi:hypothetical protein
MKFNAMLASSRKAITQARALAAVSELSESSDGVAAISKAFPVTGMISDMPGPSMLRCAGL